MAKFRVTYETVTEESAKHGEFADRGFLAPGNWRHDDEPSYLTLREAVDLVPRGTCENSGRWFSTVDPDINYRTGEHEYRSVHPPRTISDSSYKRLMRIFGGRQ